MKAHYTPLSKQHGIVIPLVVIAMLALLGVTGLALDMGHMYVNKTRLQNALDAAALSAAKTLDETASTTQAHTAGTAAFNQTRAANGNQEMAGLTVAFTYSHQLNPFPTAGTPVFVRAKLAGAGTFSRPSWLIQVLGIANTTVGGSAVAGPSPTLNPACGVIPVVVCGTPGLPDFGYPIGSLQTLHGGWKDSGIGPGNFQNIDLGCAGGGGGANCVRENFAGGYDGCLSTGGSVNTKPGENTQPNIMGMNTRFDCPTGAGLPGCGPLDTSKYLPDKRVDAGASGYPDTYQQYKDNYATEAWDRPNGDKKRREVIVPIGNCSTAVNGAGTLPILGFGCFFLREPADKDNADKDKDKDKSEFVIKGEFIGRCEGQGVPGSTPSLNGPTTIILYKDFSTGPTVPDA